LAWQRLRLFEDLLIVQAEEALESAEAGYIAGALNTLDLIDAQKVLFEAQTAVARARTDYLIGLSDLDGSVGRPWPPAVEPARMEAADGAARFGRGRSALAPNGGARR